MNSEPRSRNISFQDPEAEAYLCVLYVFVSFASCHEIPSRSLTKLHASFWSSRTPTWNIRTVSEAEFRTLRIWRTPTWGGTSFAETYLQIALPRWLQRWEQNDLLSYWMAQMVNCDCVSWAKIYPSWPCGTWAELGRTLEWFLQDLAGLFIKHVQCNLQNCLCLFVENDLNWWNCKHELHHINCSQWRHLM